MAQRRRLSRIEDLYPEAGPLRRELYAKHMAFFAAGAEHQERCMMAANRIGKSFGVGGYEVTLHLTGRYPEWWAGRRFDGPVQAWAAGDTSETTRDVIQAILFGSIEEGLGTGLINGKYIIGEPIGKRAPARAVDTAVIQHVSGGTSMIGMKSFDQGRQRFQGTAKHLIWLDEEPPADVYDECLMRLMTTDGLMLCTFTPLLGLSEVALRFLPHLKVEPATKAAARKELYSWEKA